MHAALLLAGMAKEILQGIMATAEAALEGTSFEVDLSDLEGSLRTAFVSGTLYAQPLTPFAVLIIQEALNDVNTKKLNPKEAQAKGLLQLTALDALICATAKQKASITALHLSAPVSAINELVRQNVDGKATAGMPQGMAPKVIELVLSIIDSKPAVVLFQKK